MSGIDNLGGTGPVQKVSQGFVPTVTLKKMLLTSTLSPSQQQEILSLYLAPVPTLEPPRWNVPEIVEGIMVNPKIWENYLTFLHEQGQKMEREITSPDHLARVQATSPLSTKRVIDDSKVLISAMRDYVDNHKGDADAAPFMAVALVIAAGFIGAYMSVVDVASTSMMTVKPIIDAAAVTMQVLPSQFVDPSLMVINLFATATLYTATLGMVGQSQSTGDKPKNIDFARNYADEIMTKVKGNEINRFMYALLVHTLENGQPISNQRADQIVTYSKLMMLSVALTLFYKVETGGLTGEEFAGILKNNPYKEGTPEHELIVRINGFLGQIGTFASKEESARVLEFIVGYADSNHSIDDMLKPEKVYSSMLETTNDREIRG